LSVHAIAKEESSNMDSTKIATILSEIRQVNDSIIIEQKLSRAQEIALNSKTDWILPLFIIEKANIYIDFSYKNEQINILLDSAELYIHSHHLINVRGIDLLVRIANLHKRKRNFAKAIKLQNSILSLKPDLATSIAIYGNLGLIYSHIHDYTNSLKHYQKAIQLIEQNVDHARDTDDSMTITALEMTVGEIYLEINQYDKALMHFRNTEKYFNNSIKAMLSKEIQIRQCKAYLGMKSYDVALPQLLELYAAYKNDEDNKLVINTLLVGTYIKLDSYKLATEYLHKTLALQALPIYSDLNSRLLIYNGQLAAHNHQYAAAIQYYQEAIKACASNNVLADALDAW
jgi:tetratricopeptide (TPR) repeat protein